MERTLLERITIDPEICHGMPCVRGMRWPVEVIWDMLGSGVSTAVIVSEHQELEKEELQVCLHYAKHTASGNHNTAQE